MKLRKLLSFWQLGHIGQIGRIGRIGHIGQIGLPSLDSFIGRISLIGLISLIGPISLIGLISLQAVAQTPNPRYEWRLDEIDKAIIREEWGKADSLIVAALKDDPSNPNNSLLLSNLGMIRHYNGNDEAAIEALDDALRMAPNSVTILSNRARIYALNGRIADALADYDHIEKVDSTYTETYLMRGSIALYSGDFERAERDVETLKRLDPDNPESLLLFGSFYSITSRPQEAIPYYSRLLRTSKSADVFAAKAICELNLDLLPEAAEDIAEGLELDPDYHELYLARAILNKKRFENDAMLRDAKRALDLGANPTRLRTILGI